MANGDVTVSLEIEGGVTKTVTLTSDTRVKAKLVSEHSNDADWAAATVNALASLVATDANQQLRDEASWSPVSFTAAT